MLKSKEAQRIFIKSGLQMVPEDERLNALNMLIEEGGAGTSQRKLSFKLRAHIVVNIVMSFIAYLALSTGNEGIGTALVMGGVGMWGCVLVLVYLEKKDNSSTNWAKAAYEIRDEWSSK